MTGPVLRCSPAALVRGDLRAGTSPHVTRWFLVEHPGPWGRDALSSARLDEGLASRLAAAGRRGSVRVLLIRRVGRHAAVRDGSFAERRWMWVDSRPGRESTRAGNVASNAEAVEVLDALVEAAVAPEGHDGPRDGPGRPEPRPVYLACTHGRHDPCCAIYGRPTAAALAESRPEQTWECSHLGGDRFAANVLVLPHGLLYGHVGPAAVPALVSTHERGRVDTRLLRGRTCFPPYVQAAQHFARISEDVDAIEALSPLAVYPRGEHAWRVVLEGGGGEEVSVELVSEPAATPGRLTCAAGHASWPQSYRVLGLERGSSTQPRTATA